MRLLIDIVVLWWLAAALPLGAQSLVTNGEFTDGGTDGWALEPAPGGGVIGHGDGGIGLYGELYQDLATTPGQKYVLSFWAQGFAATVGWRSNSLQAFWGDELIAAYGFSQGDGEWYQPHCVVSAASGTTRVRFVGNAYPSLDAVAVVPTAADTPVFRIAQPIEGAEFVEGENVVVVVGPDESGPAGTAVSVRVRRGGTELLGAASGSPWTYVWENAMAGSQVLSAEVARAGGEVVTTSPVTVIVRTRPKVRFELPRSRAVFTPGEEVEIRVQVTGNDGAIGRAVCLVNGVRIGQSDAPLGEATVSVFWQVPAEGNYRLTVRGEGNDGTWVSVDERDVHVLPTGAEDQVQGIWGAWVQVTPAAPIAQVFRAGGNARLRQVELPGAMIDASPGSQYTPLTASIVAVENGLPGTNVLGSTSWTFLEVQQQVNGSFVTAFSFPSNRVGLVAGRQYALVVTTAAAAGISFRCSLEDTYGGGSLFQWGEAGWQTGTGVFPAGAGDLAFRTVVIPNEAPVTSITAPEPLATYSPGSNLAIRAAAADADGRVVRVEFRANDQILGLDSEPPYELTWTNIPAGNPVLTALAVDDLGAVGASAPVSVIVGLPAGLPRLRISDVYASEAVAGATPLTFTVVLSRASDVPVTVQYATADDTATAGEDYEATSGTLTFTPGETQAAIPVALLPDVRDEPHERFFLNLRYPSNAVIEIPQAVGTVVDDEPGRGKVAFFMWQLDWTVQTALVPFPIRLEARDVEGRIATNVVGEVYLTVRTAAGGVLTNRVAPEALGAPKEGVWTNDLVLRLIGDGFSLEATDEFGHAGQSPMLQVRSAAGDLIPLALTEVASLTNASAQTGLFDQRVRIENLGVEAVAAFVASVTNLPPRVRVLGTRTDSSGQSWLWQSTPLLPGESVEWHIEYYDPTRVGAFSPQLAISLEVPEFLEPAGPQLQVRRTVPLAGGAILVEFDAPRGYVVWIEYSADLEEWKTAGGTVVGDGQRVVWIDQGPPKTAVHPAEDGQRYYRLRLAEH